MLQAKLIVMELDVDWILLVFICAKCKDPLSF